MHALRKQPKIYINNNLHNKIICSRRAEKNLRDSIGGGEWKCRGSYRIQWEEERCRDSYIKDQGDHAGGHFIIDGLWMACV